MLSVAALVANPALSGLVLANAPSTTADTAALKKFEEGKKAYDEGLFAEALTSFQASLALLPSPNTRLYVARCQRAVGRIGSAYVSYNLAVREATDRLAAGEKRFKATKEAAAVEMAEIGPKVPRLTLEVPTDVPEGFVVKLDGVEVPKPAWGTAVETDPGKHLLTAAGPRRKPYALKFFLDEGQQKVLAVEAERVPSGTLSLVFASRPSGMSVQLDGVAIDPAKIEGAREVDVGTHTLVVAAPGHASFRWSGEVSDSKETKVDVKLAPTELPKGMAGVGGGTPRWVPLTIGGAGVVTLGLATVFAVQAKGLSDDQLAKDGRVRTVDDQARIKTLSTRANVLFVAGGVLVVGAAVLAFTARWSDPTGDAHARLVPWVAPGGGGFLAVRAF